MKYPAWRIGLKLQQWHPVEVRNWLTARKVWRSPNDKSWCDKRVRVIWRNVWRPVSMQGDEGAKLRQNRSENQEGGARCQQGHVYVVST